MVEKYACMFWNEGRAEPAVACNRIFVSELVIWVTPLMEPPHAHGTRICFRGSGPLCADDNAEGRVRAHVLSPLVYNEIAKGFQSVLARTFGCSPRQKRYGVSSLILVDQLASAERVPTPPGVPAHVPSRLSPLPPAKNGPPQVV
jgi:hypothetical protein